MENSNKHLTLGKKIFVEVATKDTNHHYISQILDILDSDKFIIRAPIKNKTHIPINKEDTITVVYYEQNQGRYKFSAEVLDYEIGDAYKLMIAKKTKIQRIQERSFYRLEIGLDVIKHYEINEEIVEESCKTQDISGSGMMLLTNYQHQIDDIINISILLDREKLTLKSRVVRLNDINHTDYKYAIGVNFFSLSSNTKDKIIKYIFKEQRKYRKKGLM